MWLSAAMIIALCFPIAASNSAARHLGYRLFRGKPEDRTFSGAKAVSQWLRQQPDRGSIFVWGFIPEIYVLSDRAPASRFVLCTGLSGMIPWVESKAVLPEAWEIFREEMQLNPAGYIVDTSPGGYRTYERFPPEEAPELWSLIQTRYCLATTILQEGQPAFRIFRLEGSKGQVNQERALPLEQFGVSVPNSP